MQAEIQSGTWPVDQRLPSERALSSQFKASRVVIREALAALRSKGMVVSRRGSGTYVAAQTPTSDGLILTALEGCEPKTAQDAMRRHLSLALKRYRNSGEPSIQYDT